MSKFYIFIFLFFLSISYGQSNVSLSKNEASINGILDFFPVKWGHCWYYSITTEKNNIITSQKYQFMQILRPTTVNHNVFYPRHVDWKPYANDYVRIDSINRKVFIWKQGIEGLFLDLNLQPFQYFTDFEGTTYQFIGENIRQLFGLYGINVKIYKNNGVGYSRTLEYAHGFGLINNIYYDSTTQITNKVTLRGAQINDIVYGNYWPVELSLFNSKIEMDRVLLNWETKTELNNHGFEIERSIDKKAWTRIAFVKGHNTTTEPNKYCYIDHPGIDAVYFYRLKQVDLSGVFEYSDVLTVNFVEPFDFGLKQNFPNPFNPSTKIHYSLTKNGHVVLKVFNALGQEVKQLVNDFQEKGGHEAIFDAANLPAGIYFAKLTADDFSKTIKMVYNK